MWGCHRRRRISEEAGFALIEALVGAVILIVIALATLSAIDRAQKTSGFAKNKSVAGALAEQDQARLRGLPADSLSTYATNHVSSRTVTVNGLNYTVASQVDWIRDSTGGTLSCTNNSSQADYLKMTSTVSANSIKPVSLTSLSAPPLAYSASRGTLVVQVNDGATIPAAVPGVSVNISGPVSQSGTTNALGCVVFGFIPAGAYSVSILKGGYVDPTGDATPSVGNKSVTGGSLTTQPFTYDQAGSIPVSFETDIGTSTSSVIRSRGYGAGAENSGLSGVRVSQSNALPPVPSVTLDAVSGYTMFPFRTAYGVYSGACASSDPKTTISNWFTSGPGMDDSVTVPVGGQSPGVTVRQSSLRARVTNSAGTYLNGATVVVTPTNTTQSQGCVPKDTQWTTAKNPADNSDGWITKNAFDFGGSIGNVTYDPGVPIGTYSVCASYNFGTTSAPQWRTTTPKSVNATTGGATASFVTFTMPSIGGSSTQPCT
jgi:Tfp pilus assembly protein PilV